MVATARASAPSLAFNSDRGESRVPLRRFPQFGGHVVLDDLSQRAEAAVCPPELREGKDVKGAAGEFPCAVVVEFLHESAMVKLRP
jgi:hypothetical protein